MKIKASEDLGQIIRKKRKQDRLTLHDASALCGVSHVFLSTLENGKESVQFNKVLQVAACLGIELSATIRGWDKKEADV